MTPGIQLASAVALAATLGLAAPGIAIASDDDTREISNYVLSESGLAKFTQATQNLAAVPGACAREDDEDSDSQSLDEMVAKVNGVPGAQAAIQSAGMTTREYLVFSWSIIQTGMAAWALSQPGGKLPPDVSQANVDFYKKHEAELAAIPESVSCNDEDDSGEADTDE